MSKFLEKFPGLVAFHFEDGFMLALVAALNVLRVKGYKLEHVAAIPNDSHLPLTCHARVTCLHNFKYFDTMVNLNYFSGGANKKDLIQLLDNGLRGLSVARQKPAVVSLLRNTTRN